MVLTVDIGNTNIVLGVFDQDELVFTARVSTDKNRTADEYSVMIHGIFEINGFDLSRFDGIILSSVVPQLNSVVAYALGRFTSVRIRTVGPGLRTGFRILADDPTELGSDMVCNVAGALSEFEGPLTIVDFGTATTFTVVNAQSDICGVIIAPGMRISAEALTGGTAQLPPIPLDGEVKVFGRHSGDGGRHAGPDRRGTGYTGEADRHRRNFGTAGTADPPRAGAPSQPAGTGIVQPLQAQHPFGTVKMNLF